MGLTFGPTPVESAQGVFERLVWGPQELAGGQAYAVYVPFQPHTVTPILGHGLIVEPLRDRIRHLIVEPLRDRIRHLIAKLGEAGFEVSFSPLYWSDSQWAVPVGHAPILMGDTALLADTLCCINAIIRASGFQTP